MCELMVEWRGEDRRPVRLQYRVNLKGAKAPKDYFQLVLDPAEGSMHIRVPKILVSVSAPIPASRLDISYWDSGVYR